MVKKWLRHFMKNLRFFVNLCPPGDGLSYMVKNAGIQRPSRFPHTGIFVYIFICILLLLSCRCQLLQHGSAFCKVILDSGKQRGHLLHIHIPGIHSCDTHIKIFYHCITSRLEFSMCICIFSRCFQCSKLNKRSFQTFYDLF